MNSKILTKSILLLGFILLSSVLAIQAQDLGDCGVTEENMYTPEAPLNNCTNLSNAWLNKYRTPEYWIPDANTPIKTIRVNWVICRKDDGSGGWIDTPQFRDEVDKMFQKLNERYGNVPQKGYSLTCEPNINFISDTRIRFELNEIIFIDSTEFYNIDYDDAFNFSQVINYLDNNYPDHRKALTHIFTGDNDYNSAWGIFSGYDNQNYVATWGSMFGSEYVWWLDHERHIAHEYGHGLGLTHTYGSEETYINHFDFLDDVFGLCAEPNYCNPVPPRR